MRYCCEYLHLLSASAHIHLHNTVNNNNIVECSSSDDCGLLGEGSGLGNCENGVCVINEDCTVDTDCASLLGFSCGENGKCKDPGTDGYTLFP